MGSHSGRTSKKQVRVTLKILAGLAIVILGTYFVVQHFTDAKTSPTGISTSAPTSGQNVVSVPDSSPTPKPVSYPATPSTTSAEVAAAPLDYYDAVIPSLLTGAQAKPTVLYQIASPTSTEVPLYASMSATASPIAKLAAGALTTPQVTDTSGAHPTEVSVVGHFGGWLLITSPGRITSPVLARPATKGKPAVSAQTAAVVSFAYARASDFTVHSVTDEVVVNNSASTVALVNRNGKVIQTAAATLGASDTPSPAGTVSYIQASYPGTTNNDTCGQPINLTGAHSPTLPSYGQSGDAALVGIHCSTLTNKASHGCVRTSVSMTDLLTKYVGYAVVFS
jgi:hypothetical protein